MQYEESDRSDGEAPGPGPHKAVAGVAARVLGAATGAFVEYPDAEAPRVAAVAGEPLLRMEPIPSESCLAKQRPGDRPLVIRDVERHRDAAYVAHLRESGIRSALGVSLRDASGQGALLCVLDREPRSWTADERQLIRSLADVAAVLTPPRAAAGGSDGSAEGATDSELMDPARIRQLSRLEQYFAASPHGCVIATSRGEIVQCNQEFARLFGYETPEAAKGKPLNQLERAAGSFEKLGQRLERGEIVDTEVLEVKRIDGEPAEVLATVSGYLDEDGRLVEICAFLSDVTETRRTERALRVSQEMFNLVEAATQDVLWIWDVTTDSLTWNNGGPRRFRYAPDEMRPTIDWHVQRIHPDDRDRVVSGVQAALNGLATAWTAEYRFRRGDGSYATVLDRACIVRGERGEAVRVIGWMLEISQWREAEDASRFLANASAVLESTLDLHEALDSIVTLTAGFMADYCRIDLLDENGGLERMASHPKPDKEVSDVKEFVRSVIGPLATDPFPIVLDQKEMIVLGRPMAEDEGRATDPSSASTPESATAHGLLLAPIINRDRLLGLFTLVLNGSGGSFPPVALIRAKELARVTGIAIENCRLYATAQQAVLDREELLRFVSHDLRNPLHAIISAVTLARDLGTERRQDGLRWLDPVERAADQMRQLLEDLLDTARMESGHFALEPSWNSVDALATTACDVLRPLAESRSIELACEVESGLPKVWLDFQQFLRVLSNLLVNALKFSESGKTVRLKAQHLDGELVFSVHDSGPGIPAPELSSVFTKFWQARPGDRRGIGLGLSIARGIVEAHGGRAWVESTPGQGSVFYVTVPIAREAEAA